MNAQDQAGNTNSLTNSYSVQYSTSCGRSVLQPLQQVNDPSGLTKRYKLGSTLPIKFQLCDYNGKFIGPTKATLTVYLVGTTVDIVDTLVNLDSGASNDNGNLFRYDPVAQQYIYNLSTKSTTSPWKWSAPATYKIVITLDDGTQITTYFELSK